MSGIEALSCQELVELVTEYDEGALTGDARRRFEEHLAACEGCERYLAQMRTTIALAGRMTWDDLAPEAERVLLAAFREWKR